MSDRIERAALLELWERFSTSKMTFLEFDTAIRALPAATVAGAEAADLRTLIADIHTQHGDDLCWMDIDRIFAAVGLPVPDRRVGDKFAMLKNCGRFIETMCAGGSWRSYADLEAENAMLRAQIDNGEPPRVGAAEAARGDVEAATDVWPCSRSTAAASRSSSARRGESGPARKGAR